MPEGDSILRMARMLHRALAGKTITRFESVLPALLRVDDQTPLRGRKVERVGAEGKHLLMEFSGDLILRTHMRMNGRWQVYRPGQRWRRPQRDVRIIVATDDVEAVGFNIPVADFHRGGVRDLATLGPDILSDDFDVAAAIERIRKRPSEEIADVLLNQRVVAGIGNIYKSEALFGAKVFPFAAVQSLDEPALMRILKYARGMMRRAVVGPRDRWAVYERGGQPCRKCGTAIERRKHGLDARSTYWCPKCQGAGSMHRTALA